MTQPDRVPTERTNKLDIPFVILGALLVALMFCPVQFLIVRQFVTPPVVDERAIYASGAFDACAYFGTSAGAPPEQVKAVCDELSVALASQID